MATGFMVFMYLLAQYFNCLHFEWGRSFQERQILALRRVWDWHFVDVMVFYLQKIYVWGAGELYPLISPQCIIAQTSKILNLLKIIF
ncbi:MAG: hypothetical protein CM15mP111_3580 [Hyphomicrobiales bacterium]|nr:MAG: hypothetical protein CM15mP111_3580 [Hyphomicrobiales bacterium]